MSVTKSGDTGVHTMTAQGDYLMGMMNILYLRPVGMSDGDSMTIIAASGTAASPVDGGHLATLTKESDPIPVMRWLEGIKLSAHTSGTLEVHTG
jgi:hypothetical protein